MSMTESERVKLSAGLMSTSNENESPLVAMKEYQTWSPLATISPRFGCPIVSGRGEAWPPGMTAGGAGGGGVGGVGGGGARPQI